METQLAVQEFLRTGGTLAALAEQYAVKAVRHKAFPNLVLLKYSQIASDMSLRIVQECRGLSWTKQIIGASSAVVIASLLPATCTGFETAFPLFQPTS